MSDHRISITIDGYGCITAEFFCDATPDADCRNSCDHPDCEEWCNGYDVHRPDWTQNLYGCNAVECLGESDWTETYDGPETEVRCGPIEVGAATCNAADGYVWRYTA